MRAVFLYLTPLLALAGAQAPPEDRPLTIEEAVRIALQRHPDVEKARAAAEALKGKIREVRAQALPDVAIHVNATRWRDPSLLNASGIEKFPEELRNALVPQGVNLFDYNVTLKQPLYTAGKVGTALRLASIEAEGSAVDIDRAAQDLALNVVRACYDLLWAERYLTLVEETQRQRRAHLDMARTRYQNGVATEVDVLRSEVAVANGEPDLVRARNAIRQARALLNFYLVRPIDFPTRLAASLEDAPPWEQWDLELLAAEAFRRRPELVRLRIAERSAETQLELARAESRMRADFTGSYGVMARLPENLVNSQFVRWIVGVNFTLPVFDGFRRSGLVWQATAARRAARLEREKVEQQVRLTLQQALDDLKAARETVEAARANVRQAERVLQMTQENYQYGAATTLDVVDAQTALTVARTNLLRGLHDYSVARANLLWAIGRRPEEK
ncbi:MAG TPA: TolC family protein [Bryobacteraceae bacterium]|nr:TolC family protein [Bryobacteraceae bacterium]